MKSRGNFYFLIFVIVAMLAVFILSALQKYYESKLLPMIISGIVLILAGIGLGREMAGGGATRGKKVDEDQMIVSGSEWRRILLALTWLTGFILIVFLIGFIVAIPIFVAAYMKTHGTKWFTAITFAVISTAFMYGVFEIAMKVTLYRGILFG